MLCEIISGVGDLIFGDNGSIIIWLIIIVGGAVWFFYNRLSSTLPLPFMGSTTLWMKRFNHIKVRVWKICINGQIILATRDQ